MGEDLYILKMMKNMTKGSFAEEDDCELNFAAKSDKIEKSTKPKTLFGSVGILPISSANSGAHIFRFFGFFLFLFVFSLLFISTTVHIVPNEDE